MGVFTRRGPTCCSTNEKPVTMGDRDRMRNAFIRLPYNVQPCSSLGLFAGRKTDCRQPLPTHSSCHPLDDNRPVAPRGLAGRLCHLMNDFTPGAAGSRLCRIAAGYLKSLAPLADDLATAAQLAAQAAARAAKGKFAAARRTKRGAVLRPGRDTPLWNELAAAVQRTLRRRVCCHSLDDNLSVPAAKGRCRGRMGSGC